MTVYGYCRVSTPRQSIDRQIQNIRAVYPEALIVTDEYTGTTLLRPGWIKLYKKLASGDTVVFDQASRMSRDADEGFQQRHACVGKQQRKVLDKRFGDVNG